MSKFIYFFRRPEKLFTLKSSGNDELAIREDEGMYFIHNSSVDPRESAINGTAVPLGVSGAKILRIDGKYYQPKDIQGEIKGKSIEIVYKGDISKISDAFKKRMNAIGMEVETVEKAPNKKAA